MADRKSIIQTLSDFSKKIQAMSQVAEVTFQKETSAMKSLQTYINQQEEERQKYLQSRLTEYMTPITQDIEADEENLMKAYNLFLKLHEINKTDGDSTTHLKSYLLTSPICRKTEYIASFPSENFSLFQGISPSHKAV